MFWLAAEIWVLLIIAFALGAACGVWASQSIRGKQHGSPGDTAAFDEAAAPEQPAILLDAPDGPKDDLTQIIGLDAKTEAKLNELGVFHLRQIASWDEGAARWVEFRLNQPGRVVRERWTEQAASIG